MICPHCQQPATFHSHRPKTFVSLFGPITVRRAYYPCRLCGDGCFPFDAQASLSKRDLTLAAEEVVTLTGQLTDGFGEAADKILPRLTGLHFSESTVQRITEDVGGLLGDWLDQGCTFGEATAWQWRTDARGRRVAYVSIDATAVPQQGPGGKKAEGRMPYVAMVYNPARWQPEPDAAAPPPTDPPPRRQRTAKERQDSQMQAHYLAGLYSLASLGVLLRKQAAQVGMEQAEQWIGLSDGGNGLEEFLRQNFNRENLEVILDFYHPASRAEELARSWQEGDEERAGAQAAEWCGVLKRQGGGALLEQLRALPPPRGGAAKAKLEEMLVYLENQKHRMDYPRYIREGWYIGSGPVESACKTVVGQRLKLAGMRWGERGTDQVCHLRALFKSEKDQWEAFWSGKVNKGSISSQQH